MSEIIREEVDLTAVDPELLKQLEQQGDESEDVQLERIKQLGKEKEKALNHLSRALYLKNESKRGKKDGNHKERAARRSLASRQLRAAAQSVIRPGEREVFKSLGMAPVHESANTVGWLEDTEVASLRKRQGEQVVHVWAMKFKMPDNLDGAATANERAADLSEELSATLHIDVLDEEELASRTLHLGRIPPTHIVDADSMNPGLGLDVMTQLAQKGDVDVVTVRVRKSGTETSWALVTFTEPDSAKRCVDEGIRVPDHTRAAPNRLVPEIELVARIFDEDTAKRDAPGALAMMQHRHQQMERKYRAQPISHEAWATADRCLACDLEIAHHLTADRRHVMITLAATVDVLAEEAKLSRMHMRMAETKGMMEFHPDLLSFYSSNHGGLNETYKGDGGIYKWQPRDLAKAADWNVRPTTNVDLRDPEGWKQGAKLFTSAHAQTLVMKRMQRLGRIDPYLQSHCPSTTTALKYMKSRVCSAKRKRVTAEKVHELLLAYGGYRPHSADIFPKVLGAPVVHQLAEACLRDPMFILHQDGLLQSNVFDADDKSLPTYTMLIDGCRVMEAWAESLGREETFVGTMVDFFPIHAESELSYLKRDWGRFSIMFQKTLSGYSPECAPPKVPETGTGSDTDLDKSDYINNTHGSSANTPTVYSRPMLLVYQPLEEVRDYFGDDIGLYFCWLDRYTRALFLMSFYGTFVMFRQLTKYKGPDDNPLTLVYSIYVGVWSILFLQSWNRREVELRFLWGLDGLKHRDETRREFMSGPNATLEVNPDTGRQYYIVKNAMDQWIRKAISFISVFFLTCITVASSTMAILVRYIKDEDRPEFINMDPGHGSAGDDATVLHHYFYSRKYEILSAFLGLFVIVLYGMIFEGLATKLNKYENHRTQAEYDDSLILKNFMFQFLNNYWALIYIAYMREIPDPFSKEAHPCEDGSCLSELQFQLLVVFSFKTIGKQIGFTLRPFLFKGAKGVLANRQVAKSLTLLGDASEAAVKAVPGGDRVLEFQADASNLMGEYTTGVLDAAFGQDPDMIKEGKGGHVGLSSYEIQDSLMTYTGTFNDFNDRTVQFGYIVLFAPAFPLAPLLAFVNNIIEIRAAGYKLCHGYRRPVVKQRLGLGTWMTVLNTLGFLAVIMNSTMINFVGRQNARNFGVPDTPGFWEDESTTEYNEDLSGGYGLRYEDNSGLMGRLNVSALWLRFLVVEHTSMFVRVMVLALTPDTPSWIKTARLTLEYRIESVYQTNEALDQERRYREKYEAKLSAHMEEMAARLEETMTVSNLAEIFKDLDSDDSGFLMADELSAFLKNLGVMLTPLEVSLTCHNHSYCIHPHSSIVTSLVSSGSF